MTPEPPAPRRKPIATQRQFRAWLTQIEAELFHPPWHIVPLFFYLRKGELPSPDGDGQCYACAITYHQYHKVEVRVCPDHPLWSEERDLYACLRHEVFHSFFGYLNDVLRAVVPAEILDDPRVREMLDNAEDEGVNRLATMPILTRSPDGP